MTRKQKLTNPEILTVYCNRKELKEFKLLARAENLSDSTWARRVLMAEVKRLETPPINSCPTPKD